ncbi:DUF2955 domain-containing protein [Marinobacter sp. JSM 1782161]|uniref:DUF2955 domain-containing protein n=1 Tax=Marinobacter sp. JSM 1782161 TaxID=2685906 RepID=UPI0014034A4E|nr:DUF2955 domain-containing protein [Marinobacter sp. JSM 1782161]
MPVSPASRRSWRVSLVTALALAIAYGAQLELPFIAPLFAFLLALASDRPIGLKGLVGLMLLIGITLGCGLLLIPLLEYYPVTGLLLVVLGIYLSAHLLVNLGKALPGIFFMAGMTLISCVGTLSFTAALTMVDAILSGVFIAIVCQWLVFPWLPLPSRPAATSAAHEPQSQGRETGRNAALRTTALVFPVYLLALTNPAMYVPMIMKSVSLGQQTSETDLHKAGNELLGSTLAGGGLAVLVWGVLQIRPNLWVFFLATLLVSLFVCRRMLVPGTTRFSPGFWQNAMVTLFILVGPAVQDTLNGKDPYRAFAVRMSLFIALSVYAWFAARLIERMRRRLPTSNQEPLC